MNLNNVHLIGRLVKDPELRALPTGTSVCSFSLATNSAFVNKDGKKEEAPEFHAIVADRIQFGPKAGTKADAAEAVVATPHEEAVAAAV
jgi:single stranded DNA-binding protein